MADAVAKHDPDLQDPDLQDLDVQDLNVQDLAGSIGQALAAPAGSAGAEDVVAMPPDGGSWLALVEHARTLDPDPALAEIDDDALADAVCVQAAELAAATARFLELVAELVIRGVWAHQGAVSPGQWLSYAVGMASSTAREHVRVALALRSLPETRARFAQGRLSYSKVRAITRTPDTRLEPLLLRLADAAPAAHLDRIVATIKGGGQVEPASARRSLVRRSTAEGDAQFTLRVPWEIGARVEAFLDRVVEQMNEDGLPEDDEGRGSDLRSHEPMAARRADALVHAIDLASAALGADTSGLDRHTLVLHADASSLAAQPGDEDHDRQVPVTDHQGRVKAMSVRALRRMACDAGVVLVACEDGSRLPIDVGRRSRVVSVALRRALRLRDVTCRFPGCAATRHLHAHHIEHWVDDGPTDLDNLVLLCSAHHTFVHESGWDIRHDGAGRFAFSDPHGAVTQPTLRLVGAPAEAAAQRSRGSGVEPPGPSSLKPLDWYGDRLDLHATAEVLFAELERLQLPELVAA